MDRAYLHARRVLTVLALYRQIDKPFLWDLRRIVVMFGVFKIDKISSLKPENPDPLELRFVAGIIVFFYTGIDASSAADAPGKFKTITPQGIGEGLLCADLKFLPVLSVVSFFQLGNDVFLLFRGHFAKMFLQEILGLFLRARGEYGKRKTCQSGQGEIAEKFSSRITFIILILHRGFFPDDKVAARASMV